MATRPYLNAVDEAFGIDEDYAQLVKLYGEGPKTEARYSPAVCVGARKDRVMGNPDRDHVSTSHVERSNLSMRMHMRRFTRLTNAHSKKFENHCHMVALYTVWYNFARVNSAVRMSPAMAAGVSQQLWTMGDIVTLIDKAAGEPKKRGSYRPPDFKLRQCRNSRAIDSLSVLPYNPLHLGSLKAIAPHE
jgi:hypothetical protein